ncbi:MAG: GNAT family N-acetyltransferase [archaeon]
MLLIRLIKNQDEYKKTLEIRNSVFVKEQSIPKELEFDEHEEESMHFIAFEGETVVGCARLRQIDDNIKLERISVLNEFRGKGYGKEIVNFLVKYALKNNPKKIYVNAQHFLFNFYKELGFVPYGTTFFEAGIKHVKMEYKGKKG